MTKQIIIRALEDENVQVSLDYPLDIFYNTNNTKLSIDLFKTIPLEIYENTPFGISPVNYYYKK